MKKIIITPMILLLTMINVTNAAEVAPIQNAYGNVFPELAHQALEVSRSLDIDGPWYVSFTLLSHADIRIGTYAFTSTNGTTCCFNVSAIRIVTIEGENVGFGTDIISENPFPSPVNHLVVANNLSPGKYALEVSGAGNRDKLTFAGKVGATDFITRLSVTFPSAETEFEQGRIFGRQECIDNPSDCGIGLAGVAMLTEDLKLSIPIINWNSPAPIELWADLKYVPNNYTPVADDILFKVTDYGFIE